MSDGGTLTIETRTSGDWVEISVTDTGVGIDKATLPRIFERDFTTKHGGMGHGIGLANVSDFADRSGGTVAVTSSMGEAHALPRAP